MKLGKILFNYVYYIIGLFFFVGVNGIQSIKIINNCLLLYYLIDLLFCLYVMYLKVQGLKVHTYKFFFFIFAAFC
jgi:hypothetical protein